MIFLNCNLCAGKMHQHAVITRVDIHVKKKSMPPPDMIKARTTE